MADDTGAASVKKAAALRWAMVVLAIIGAAAVLYVMLASSFKPKAGADLSGAARGTLAKLVVAPTPIAAPTTGFTDAAGKPMTIADFKGQVVVLNLWATWCAPCKKEMPTLAKLQASYATQPLKVVELSVDRDRDFAEADEFIAANAPLTLYRDPGYRFAFGMTPRAEGFPTTVIFDRKGMERARLSGDADWSSPEAHDLIERLLKEG
jgi:thiol-disulfide isomerase/thioredoxin